MPYLAMLSDQCADLFFDVVRQRNRIECVAHEMRHHGRRQHETRRVHRCDRIDRHGLPFRLIRQTKYTCVNIACRLQPSKNVSPSCAEVRGVPYLDIRKEGSIVEHATNRSVRMMDIVQGQFIQRGIIRID